MQAGNQPDLFLYLIWQPALLLSYLEIALIASSPMSKEIVDDI